MQLEVYHSWSKTFSCPYLKLFNWKTTNKSSNNTTWNIFDHNNYIHKEQPLLYSAPRKLENFELLVNKWSSATKLKKVIL